MPKVGDFYEGYRANEFRFYVDGTTSPGVTKVSGLSEGEIDTMTAGALEQALTTLLAESSEALVVDLTAVTFLASSGLAVLIRAAHQAGERRLRLVSTARAVRRPIEITGSDQLFDLYSDRAAALSPAD